MRSSPSVIKSVDVRSRAEPWLPVASFRDGEAPVGRTGRHTGLTGEANGQIVQEARRQAAEVTLQARQEGLAQARAETTRLLLCAQGVLDEVQAWREQMLANSEPAVLELVVLVARKLFGDGPSLPPETLHQVFSRALAEAKPLGALRIHLNPEDAQVLGPHWPAKQSAASGQRLELVPDETVRRGGCLIQGETGSVDGRIETQLDLVRETLLNPSGGAV